MGEKERDIYIYIERESKQYDDRGRDREMRERRLEGHRSREQEAQFEI